VDLPPVARAPLGRDLAVGGGLLLAGIAFAALGSALLEGGGGSPDAMLLATLAAQAFFACAAFGGQRLAGAAVFPRGLRLGRPRLRARELALLAVGVVCVSHALSLVIGSLELRDTGTLAEIDRVVSATAGPSRWLALVALGLAPAFGEELLFRGFVQQAALRRLGAPGAIALSSLAFGLIHVDPVHTPAAFVLGLFLGAAAELAGSLWAPILCHAVNNALSLAVPALGLAVAAGPPAALAAGALCAIGVALFAWVARRAGRAGGPPGSATGFSVG
jgi:membrane protease YdiL (CAAX protease family)